MSYALEAEEEFARLERQSALPTYDYRSELQDLAIEDGHLILDAGCGSGVVSRHLAAAHPAARVIACDLSTRRLAQAIEAARALENLVFERQDLRAIDYSDGRFDVVVARYVLQHQTPEDLQRVVAELARMLRPGGRMLVVDVDGIMLNVHPQTSNVARGLRRFVAAKQIDLHVGRKVPYLLGRAGLASIAWRIETVSFTGQLKTAELELMRERFAIAAPLFEKVLGSQEQWRTFQSEYLECLGHPQAVSFNNKFIVTAVRPDRPS